MSCLSWNMIKILYTYFVYLQDGTISYYLFIYFRLYCYSLLASKHWPEWTISSWEFFVWVLRPYGWCEWYLGWQKLFDFTWWYIWIQTSVSSHMGTSHGGSTIPHHRCRLHSLCFTLEQTHPCMQAPMFENTVDSSFWFLLSPESKAEAGLYKLSPRLSLGYQLPRQQSTFFNVSNGYAECFGLGYAEGERTWHSGYYVCWHQCLSCWCPPGHP